MHEYWLIREYTSLCCKAYYYFIYELAFIASKSYISNQRFHNTVQHPWSLFRHLYIYHNVKWSQNICKYSQGFQPLVVITWFFQSYV